MKKFVRYCLLLFLLLNFKVAFSQTRNTGYTSDYSIVSVSNTERTSRLISINRYTYTYNKDYKIRYINIIGSPGLNANRRYTFIGSNTNRKTSKSYTSKDSYNSYMNGRKMIRSILSNKTLIK